MRLASRLFRQVKIDNFVYGVAFLALSLFLTSCGNRKNVVSGTVEVDEVHVGPRSGGRVEKIFAWEGDRLRAGQPIVQLEATESMPWIFYALGTLFPTTYFIALMRAIILRGAHFFEYWPNLAILIVMSILLFVLCALRFRKKIA